MARPEYSTPSKEFGDSLKYDPTFKGPLSKRSCTDVICFLLFFAFIGGWVAVGIYAFIHGDPVRLVTPVDSNGRRCGLDEGVTDKPYLFFFDLSKCATATIVSGCNTPQICVKECPTEYFYYDKFKGSELRNKIICKDESLNQQITDGNVNTSFIDTNLCASYYLPSKAAYRRCMPESVASMANNMADIPELIAKIPELEQGSTVINILAEAKELGQKIIQDLDESWPFVLGGLALAMILCLVYIVLMRWFAGIMIWFSLIGVIALLSYCCYACYVKYDEMKSAAEGGATAVANRMKMSRDSLIDLDIKQEIDDILAMKDTWLVFLIISAVALVIVLLLVLFLRKRIRIAIALIKEASKAVGSITSTLLFPLFPWFLQLFVIGWFVAVLLFLAGSSNAVYIAQNMTNCACSFLNISDGSRCYPDTFKNCENICPGAACYFSNYEKEKYVDYLHAYNIFGVFWGLFFVSGLGEMILAATFATWYWTFRKSEVPFFTLSVSITRTLRYHIGTVAFGSLILAICRVIRVILEYINHKLKKYDNAFVKAIMCCLRCFFWCLEKFIKFINRNAYIMCAIHGKNFCRSAKDAFNLLMRNVVRVFVLDKVTDFLLFLGKLLITAGMCALSFFVFTKEIKYYNEAIPTLNYSIIPVVFIGFGTYFIASIFFGVYSMAVDTLFLCFLEDCERNDGSPEKPYFMSKELMKILHKKNK